MTMHFDPLPRPLFPAVNNLLRGIAGAASRAAVRTIEAIGGICHAFAVNLMRRQMRRAFGWMSDGLLADAGITRSEIDAFIAEHIPHRDQDFDKAPPGT